MLDLASAARFAPVMMTTVATGQEFWFRLRIDGPGVKGLSRYWTGASLHDDVTCGRSEGTVQRRNAGGAPTRGARRSVPLKVTVLLPCVAPKFVPVTVMLVFTAAVSLLRLVIAGGTRMVKLDPLLANPPTVTTTLPDKLLRMEPRPRCWWRSRWTPRRSRSPLKVTVLVPCEAPKLVPAMVTLLPTIPGGHAQAGDRGSRQNGEGRSVAGHRAYGDDDVARGGSGGHRNDNAGASPGGRCGCGSTVKGHCAGGLRGAKVRSGNCHGCSDGSRYGIWKRW